MNKIASPESNRSLRLVINILSVGIPVAVAILLNPGVPKIYIGEWSKHLPHVNGIINSLTFCLMLMGLYFIRKKEVEKHRNVMMAAVVLGAFFLVSYVLYHVSNDSTSFGGQGWERHVYYFFLITHITLSVVVVRLVLLALYYALTDQISRHRDIVKWAYPIWLYVSTTGVIVYMMIRPYYT